LFRNFQGTQPSTSTANTDMDNKKKVKKPNRGFKTAADGRIIIKMDDRGGDDSDDSTAEIEGFADKAKKQVYDESDESGPEEEEADDGFGGSSRKRKAVEGSMKSGRSGATSKYTAGGKGIHRQVFYPIFFGISALFFHFSSSLTDQSHSPLNLATQNRPHAPEQQLLALNTPRAKPKVI
jgi:hypothetical protein